MTECSISTFYSILILKIVNALVQSSVLQVVYLIEWKNPFYPSEVDRNLASNYTSCSKFIWAKKLIIELEEGEQ
jgi:hypothetical protein